jgi:hypothetical protein
MSLDKTIKQYYLDNVENLRSDKQFHFASRIAAWEGDKQALDILLKLRGYMVPETNQQISNLLGQLVRSPQEGKRNAHELRQPYFQKYPRLYGIHSALFRVRHLKSIYGIDASQALFEHASKVELDELSEKLMQDEETIRILSTFAINLFYLYKVILENQADFVDLERIIEISKEYDIKNIKHVQLMIYMMTHCIIGETNFYTEEITRNRKNQCSKMLRVLEPIIEENFDNINLDNKLEFLVCCRICGIRTHLSKRVERECASSLSENGHFLVDKHNKNGQKNKVSFESSEHRNVLYIMSNSDYQPHSTLV